jgi:hypothetical protein
MVQMSVLCILLALSLTVSATKRTTAVPEGGRSSFVISRNSNGVVCGKYGTSDLRTFVLVLASAAPCTSHHVPSHPPVQQCSKQTQNWRSLFHLIHCHLPIHVHTVGVSILLLHCIVLHNSDIKVIVHCCQATRRHTTPPWIP